MCLIEGGANVCALPRSGASRRSTVRDTIPGMSSCGKGTIGSRRGWFITSRVLRERSVMINRGGCRPCHYFGTGIRIDWCRSRSSAVAGIACVILERAT